MPPARPDSPPGTGVSGRQALELAGVRAGIGVRAFGATAGTIVMLQLAPPDGWVPLWLAVAVLWANTLALTATSLRALHRGRASRAIVDHQVAGDALNMTLITVTIDPAAATATWVLTLVAIGQAGALRGRRAAIVTFVGIMVALGASIVVAEGATTAALGHWLLVLFLAGGPGAVLVLQATIVRRALARTERARDLLHRTVVRDDLTGLLNRRGLREAVMATGEVGAVLFLDLDHFKQVNDTLGHDAGDEVLRTVSRRLRGSVRDRDLAARLSGDEFAVVVPSDAVDPAELADRVRRELAAPIAVRGVEVVVGVSVGTARSEDGDPRRLLELLDAADAAMYRDKALGRPAPASAPSPAPRP